MQWFGVIIVCSLAVAAVYTNLWKISSVRNTVALKGELLNLTCNINGTGPIAWREYITNKDGAVLSTDGVKNDQHPWNTEYDNPDRNTIIFQSAEPKIAGTFGCRDDSVDLDAFAEVIVTEHPSCGFTTAIYNILRKGLEDTFQCCVTYHGSWSPVLELKNDGKLLNAFIPESSTGMCKAVNITPTTEQDNTSFSCHVSFTERPSNLNLSDSRYDPTPPEFSDSCSIMVKVIENIDDNTLLGPKNAVVKMGEPVTLECVYMGQNAAIVWSENTTGTNRILSTDGVPDPDHPWSGSYHLEWRYDLVLPSVSKQNGGTYICSVPEQNLTAVAEIIVIDEPKCSLKGSVNKTLIENEEGKLQCDLNIYGNIQPNLIWSFDDTVISGNTTPVMLNDTLSLKSSIIATEDHHEGIFVCKVAFPPLDELHDTGGDSDMLGYSAECHLHMSVLYGARDVNITVPHDGNYLIPGDKVTCQAGGNPDPQYEWHRDTGNGPQTIMHDTINMTEDMVELTGYTCVAANYIKGRIYMATGKFFYSHQERKNGTEEALIAVSATLGTIAFLLLVFVIVVFYRKRLKSHFPCFTGNNTMDEDKENETVQMNGLDNPGLEQDTFDTMSDRWRVPRENIRKLEVLGSGHFGIVYKALAKDLPDIVDGHSHSVALKTLKPNATEKERRDLEAELEIMKTLSPHENVITFLGYSTMEGNLCILMELADQGNLRDLLIKSRDKIIYANIQPGGTLPEITLVGYAIQVAKGMAHISKQKLVHRDLASRNILMSENNVCKISDFGLTRENYYERAGDRKSRLPLRWMSPEAITSETFSIEGDVWAFGVLLWEIVTAGALPYPGMGNREVNTSLRRGEVMKKPTHCGDHIYSIMKKCWNMDSSERPKFPEIVQLLEQLIGENDPPMYLDLLEASLVTDTVLDDD